ncbi:hypothetical protein [Alkalibacillus haloalkaliphilus]|uniref:hypothetical protein n=1 Tax=Alkalibacillus haloalkaliphilus TaxID=94136 RepID=UPI000317B061|nr:hypothetical protein [Alkalibacillus haloalkaliphilus]
MSINIEHFLKPVKADTRYNDADMGSEAQKFYKEYFSDSINNERGETWCTPIALLENIYDFRYKIIDKGSLKLKQYKIELISNISSNIIEGKKIGVDYHCLANFGCLPYELNKWRGSEDYIKKRNNLRLRLNLYNRSRLGDFPDLFFICVKSYLTNNPELGYDPEIEGKKLKEFDWWFEKIGGGKKCTWEDFVNKMDLKGSFVDANYEVVKLFDHKIGEPFPNLQVIKETGNNYTIDNLTEILSENTPIKTCIENIYKIWNNRAAHFEKF